MSVLSNAVLRNLYSERQPGKYAPRPGANDRGRRHMSCLLRVVILRHFAEEAGTRRQSSRCVVMKERIERNAGVGQGYVIGFDGQWLAPSFLGVLSVEPRFELQVPKG